METAASFSPSIVKVLVAALASFLLGGIWYGPLFGKLWKRLVGLSDQQMKAGNPAKIFGGAFVLAAIQAWVFAMFLGPNPTLALGLGAGASAGLCWIGFAFGINDLFERRSLGLWAVNAGYHTVVFTLFGLIFALWK